jgi:hypothetical protein
MLSLLVKARVKSGPVKVQILKKLYLKIDFWQFLMKKEKVFGKILKSIFSLPYFICGT